MNSEKLLILEPFYGGSHKKLIDIICAKLRPGTFKLITMTGKKWHWRARSSALYISTQIPKEHRFKILFSTSVLPLAELLGLRPDLNPLEKYVYFHENQLDFPVRVTKERDFQHGYNEITTCLAADKVLFNSFYNLNSFISNIKSHIKLQPDYRVKDLDLIIKPKCEVIYYPLDLSAINIHVSGVDKEDGDVLHIVWPHRWEFDKNPEAFYKTLCKLDENGYQFQVSILGETFSEKPEIFFELTSRFESKLLHCNYVEDVGEYYSILKKADVVVSTAVHEFFGVSVLEAVYCGCIPVVPNRLAYKELYEGKVDEMYNTDDELYHILADMCSNKGTGNINKDYSHIASSFEADKWFHTFLKSINYEMNNPQLQLQQCFLLMSRVPTLI